MISCNHIRQIIIINVFLLVCGAVKCQLICDEIELETASYPSNSLNIITLLDTNYFFSDFNLTWFDALLFCKSYGMDLVITRSIKSLLRFCKSYGMDLVITRSIPYLNIDSLQEDMAVKNHILSLALVPNSSGNIGVYTSAHRMGRDEWKWANGSNVNWFTDWCEGSPSLNAKHMCLEYWKNVADQSLCFHNLECNYSYGRYFVCEENI